VAWRTSRTVLTFSGQWKISSNDNERYDAFYRMDKWMFLIIGKKRRHKTALTLSALNLPLITSNYIWPVQCIPTCVPQKEKLLDTSGLVKLADKSPTPKYVLWIIIQHVCTTMP
jgi:hypothetical protein